jgi:hypothetical protein
MKTNEILTCVAILAGILGTLFSLYNLRMKGLAEKHFEAVLKRRIDEFRFLKTIGEIRNKSAHLDRELTFEEFVQVQETLKKLVVELDKKERPEILESLEQKSMKGQLDYLNKMLQLSGSSENIIIRADK